MNVSELEKNLNFLQDFDSSKKETFFKRLKIYEELFFSYQKVHNISNFKSLEFEIIDSLKILDFKNLNFVKNAIDVGSGAGFPGVFLALVLGSKFHLFEPNKKKAAFLFLIKSELKLTNLSIKTERIEASKEFFTADLISSRALTNVRDLLKLCIKFYDKNTFFLLYKGSKLEDELKEVKEYEIFSYNKRKYCFLSCSFCNALK